jgi:DNA polymerase/3'-5' exonuclease PolX
LIYLKLKKYRINKTIPKMGANDKLIHNFKSLIEKLVYDKANTGNKSISFKIINFRKVIKILESYQREITSLEDVKDTKGIGQGSLERIEQFLKNGVFDELRDSFENTTTQNSMNNLKDLQRITGVGPVKAKALNDRGFTLESILSMGKEELEENFTHHQILGIKHFHDLEKRIPRSEITKIKTYLEKLCDKMDGCLNIQVCGSYRREKPDSGDVDVLIYHDYLNTQDEVDEWDCQYLPEIIVHLKKSKFLVDDLTVKGNTKYMGMCRIGKNPVRRIDIRFIPKGVLPSALLYFTGSGEFNVNMRKFALKCGYTINEYGIFKNSKTGKKGASLEIKEESDIFKILGLEWVHPKERRSDFMFLVD